jgi:hypothetical protein
MVEDSEAVRIFSPGTARVLWIIAVAVVGLSLAIRLWDWALMGGYWTTIIGSLGMFLLVVGYAVMRSRGRLSAVLQVTAMVLIIADLTLILRRR